MKRPQPSEAEQGGEELPATPAAKRQRSRAVQGRAEQQQGSGQAGGKGAGMPPARSSPLPSAGASPAGSAEEAGVGAPVPAAGAERQQTSQPSKAGEGAPADQPAQAAKQRSRARATTAKLQQGTAAAAHSHGSMLQLADAAAGQVGETEEGVGGGSGGEQAGRPPAARPVVRGQTFSLARGEEPPCYRIWLTLQAPCSAEDVTGEFMRLVIPLGHDGTGMAAMHGLLGWALNPFLPLNAQCCASGTTSKSRSEWAAAVAAQTACACPHRRQCR